MNSKEILLAILLFLHLPLSSIASDTLRLVTLHYPPYEYLEEGEVKGIAVALIKEIFSRMDQPITIKLLPWARSIKYIEDGEADAIFTAFKTPERELFADYSTEVVMPQVISLFVRENSPIIFDGDLKKLDTCRFGTVLKYSNGAQFDNAVKEGVLLNVFPVESMKQNFMKLHFGRVDIVVGNRYVALQTINNMDTPMQVKELSPELESLPSYIAFSKKRNLSALRDTFDLILKEMKSDGSYQNIIDSYFIKK